jgi:hypothetical protein
MGKIIWRGRCNIQTGAGERFCPRWHGSPAARIGKVARGVA